MQNPVRTVDVIANTNNINSQIQIANGTKETHSSTSQIAIDSSITEVPVKVISEYGQEENYILRIYTLPDNTELDNNLPIEVNGETAVYNRNFGRYEVKFDNTVTTFNITANAKDNLASVQITTVSNGVTTGIGNATGTEDKTGVETIVPVKVTAQNGIAQSEYTLAILEKSNNSDINVVKVNGNTINPDANGNYVVDVVSDVNDVNIYVEALNQYAKVTIDAQNSNTNKMTINRTLTNDTQTYNITVVSEDGLSTTNKTLTINRLNGNKNIQSINVTTPDGNTNNVVLQSDGTYYCKIKRNNTADVTVTMEDIKAKVTIAGGTTNVSSGTETITLLNDITEVNIIAEAEDGKKEPITLIIEKESNNVKLKDLSSPEALEKISYIGGDTYELKVYNTVTNIKLTAQTEHDLAQLKLGTETIYVVNKFEDKEIDITGINSFTIDVLAEDGVTTKSYTVVITRKFDTRLENITTDGDEASLTGNVYTGWLDRDNTANIVIEPKNTNVNITVKKGPVNVASGVGTITLADAINGETASYKIIVVSPTGDETSEYYLNVTKKSDNNNIEYIKLNGDTLTENALTGMYEVEVGGSDKYTLETKAENEYAVIKYDSGNYSTSNVYSEELTIAPGETKIITITVKAQTGDELTPAKTVKIYRKDNNINAEVKVNGSNVNYDETHRNYNITLDNNITLADVEILAQSSKTKLEANIEGTAYANVQQIQASSVQLPGVGKKVLEFTITAEDGTTQNRTITIVQLSSNIELETVTVDGKTADDSIPGMYQITIGDKNSAVEIYAKTKEDKTKVSIESGAEGVHTAGYTLNNIIPDVTFVLNIHVTSEDGTCSLDYPLYIKVKSSNNLLEYVKVDNKSAEEIEQYKHRIFVKEGTSQVTVDIKAQSDLANVTADVDGVTYTGNPLTLPARLLQERTTIEYKIISDSGEEQPYTLEIFKESNDNTLQHLYVNGEEIYQDATGRYKVTVKDTDENPVVKAVANNEFAYVRIALSDEQQAQKEYKVQLQDTKITTVPITIRSQTGESKVYYLDIEKIYTLSLAEELIVDNKEITNYNDKTKTYIAIVSPDVNPHEIFMMSQNPYATVEIDGSVGVGNATALVSMADDEYEKDVDMIVTPESGIPDNYILKLVKESNDVSLYEDKVVVNDVPIDHEPGRNDLFKRKIKKLADKAKIKVTTNYPYANIKIGDCVTETGVSEQWVDLDLFEDEITVPVVVTATDGKTIETYNIVLIRASNDTSVVVKYDGNELNENADGNYEVSILDTVTNGLIEVTSNDSNAQIAINDLTQLVQGQNSYNVSIDTQSAGRTIEIPIRVIAEDETVDNRKVIITRISTDATTEKVEGKYETTDESGTHAKTVTKTQTDTLGSNVYTIGVKEDTDKIDLKITAKSEYATITRGSENGVGTLEITDVNLTTKETFVNYYITAEDGTTQIPYKIRIVKQSSDANIIELKVDNKVITKDSNGVYNAEVLGGTQNARVEVTTTSDEAVIEINGTSNKAYLDIQVDTPNAENTYTINVTAEDGTVKTYTLKITKQTNIVGKILTENVRGEHKAIVTVYKTADTRPEKIPAGSPSTTPIREIIDQVETNADGTFTLKVNDIEKYDILVTKAGYLDYRVTDIEVAKGDKVEAISSYKLLAGDIVKSGEIEINDLSAINDNYTTAVNNDTMIYDLNEDGKVDRLDRNILKKNYSKKSESVVWVNPIGAVSTALKTSKVAKSANKQLASNTSGANKENANFIVPIKCNYSITSEYGTRKHPVTGVVKKHTGIDLGGTHHTQIYAVADGEVTFAGVQNGFGNCIEIKHVVNGETIYSFYAHLSKIDVQKGQKVKQSDVIGLEGGDPSTDPNPGSSTGHHLHFEIRKLSGYGNDVDPNNYIKF